MERRTRIILDSLCPRHKKSTTLMTSNRISTVYTREKFICDSFNRMRVSSLKRANVRHLFKLCAKLEVSSLTHSSEPTPPDRRLSSSWGRLRVLFYFWNTCHWKFKKPRRWREARFCCSYLRVETRDVNFNISAHNNRILMCPANEQYDDIFISFKCTTEGGILIITFKRPI